MDCARERGLPCAGKQLFPVSYPIFPSLRSAAGIFLLKTTPTVDKADQKLLQAKWVMPYL